MTLIIDIKDCTFKTNRYLLRHTSPLWACLDKDTIIIHHTLWSVNAFAYQQEVRPCFPAHQSFPNITFPVTHTHISVIMANISQEHLVIKHVVTNASRGRKKKAFPYFFRTRNISITGPWRNQSGNSTTKKRDSKLSFRDNGKVGGLLLKSELGFMGENAQQESWNEEKLGEEKNNSFRTRVYNYHWAPYWSLEAASEKYAPGDQYYTSIYLILS